MSKSNRYTNVCIALAPFNSICSRMYIPWWTKNFVGDTDSATNIESVSDILGHLLPKASNM